MTNAADSMAPDAKWVIDACVARGYEIAVATAGCRADFVKSYLARRVEPDVFTPALLASPAFQACQPVKSESLPKIMAYYGLAAVRASAMHVASVPSAASQRCPGSY